MMSTFKKYLLGIPCLLMVLSNSANALITEDSISSVFETCPGWDGNSGSCASNLPHSWDIEDFTFQIPADSTIDRVFLYGTWGGNSGLDGSAPADLYIDGIKVASCNALQPCAETASGSSVSWYTVISPSIFPALLDGRADMTAVQRSETSLNITNLRIEIEFTTDSPIAVSIGSRPILTDTSSAQALAQITLDHHLFTLGDQRWFKLVAPPGFKFATATPYLDGDGITFGIVGDTFFSEDTLLLSAFSNNGGVSFRPNVIAENPGAATGFETFQLVAGDLNGNNGVESSFAQNSISLFAVANQNAVLEFLPGLIEVNEGSGTIVVPVTRSVNTDSVVTVDYSTSDSSGGFINNHATSGEDYVATSGTLTFSAGEDTKNIDVEIVDDDFFESPSEGFHVNLINPSSGAQLGSSLSSGLRRSVAIKDNDPAPVVDFSPASVNLSVSEDSQFASLTVTLSGASDTEVRLGYEIQPGSATPNDDYSALNATDTLLFSPGEVTAIIAIPITDDLVQEADEVFSVTLTRVQNPITIGLGTNITANIAIKDNDTPLETSTIELDQALFQVPENVGIINVPVYRTGNTNSSATVNYTTVNGSARAGEDYIESQGTLSFASGESVKTFTVVIVDGAMSEPSEYFDVSLSNPTNAELGIGKRTIAINDNDELPPEKLSLRSDGVPSQAEIYAGVTLDNGITYSSDFTVNQVISMISTIVPESQDIGKMADIFLVGIVLSVADETFFQVTDRGLESFDGSVANLKAFDRIELSESTFLDLLQSFGGRVQLGSTEVGNYRLFVGYATTDVRKGGSVIYTNDPIILRISD